MIFFFIKFILIHDLYFSFFCDSAQCSVPGEFVTENISPNLDGNDVIFEVKDNGVGMTQEQVDNILKKELTDSKGIGVKNVNDRIKIYFGDEYGITVMSELDEGTTIKIKIPKVGGSEYEN